MKHRKTIGLQNKLVGAVLVAVHSSLLPAASIYCNTDGNNTLLRQI
jgi:hypothetical protein